MKTITFKDFSVGADIENIKRFRRLNKKTDKIFFKKILTDKELAYCFISHDPAPHLAGRFSAKEAIIKALGGLGENGLAFNKMEILNNKIGAPEVFFKEKKFKKYRIKITISHTKDLALAMAIALKK